MSLLQFQHHGYTWGIIRNQKCASTSILSYIAQVLWNADAQEIQTYNSFQKFAPEVYFKSNSFDEYHHKLLTCDIRIAVWRNPVEKFVSGFYHTMFSPTGAQDSLWLGPRTLDEFLYNYEYYYTNSLNVREHCSSNTARLGSNPAIYTHVFNYNESYKLADLLGAQTIVNLRNTSSKPALTNNQTEKIKILLSEDYLNGWS